MTASAAGIVSLSFQLFAGCIQGFVLLSTAHNLGRDASTIICMLNLQEIHLTEWGRTAGLLDGELDRRLNVRVVEETLQLLQIPSPVLAHEKHPQTSSSPTSEIDGVFSKISNETRNRVLARAGLIQSGCSFPRRLWWAAVDKESIERLVEKINVLIRELWMLLEPWRQDDLLRSTQAIESNMIALMNRFDQLSSLNHALQQLETMSGYDRCSSRFQGLADTASIKATKVGLETDTDNRLGDGEYQIMPPRGILLQGLEKLTRNRLQNFQPMRKCPEMGIAQYDTEAVFVEWKEINPLLRKKIIPRIENLAALLNLPKDPSFRSLHCRGTIEHDNRIAFIYAQPSQTNGIPKSLYDLFSAKDGIEPPSLTARIQLSLCIARSVRSFHRAGWLHKDLRSANILFFPRSPNDSKNSPQYDIESPVLAGFSFSRFASPTEISEQPSADPQRDVYRHPDALGEASESFNAFMDLYSLGTILVEISEWRGLKFLVQSIVNVDNDTVPFSKIAQVQSYLLSGRGKGGTSKMRAKMGDIYNMACMECLGGGKDNELNSAAVLGSVINKLESCRV
ncbi:hypothetical protein ACMFMG_001877 [Clarireedia jacksonii]